MLAKTNHTSTDIFKALNQKYNFEIEQHKQKIRNLEDEIEANNLFIQEQQSRDNFKEDLSKNTTYNIKVNNGVIGENVKTIKPTALTSKNAVSTNDNATLNFSENK